MKTLETTKPAIFLTDYASYNEGKQFELGHWVDLTQFNDVDELNEYITNHFKECDKKSPLGFGTIREEVMITDFEGFPKEFYSESYNNKLMEELFVFLNLDNWQQLGVIAYIEQGYNINYAIEHFDEVTIFEYNGNYEEKYRIFEEYYPEAEKIENSNPYVNIDYDRFIKDEFNECEYNGINFLYQLHN